MTSSLWCHIINLKCFYQIENPVKILINAKYLKPKYTNNNIKILPINSVEYCFVGMFIQIGNVAQKFRKFRQIVSVYDEKKSGKVHFLSSGSRFGFWFAK